MKALVTGGAGAIGGNLVARLLGQGHEVVVLDDLSSGHRELVPEGATLLEGSVADPNDLASAFEPVPDVVLHLAALFANQNSVDHPELDLLVNGAGTLAVLERARQAGVAKVLVCSSSCIYASGEPVLVEDLVQRSGATPYAITKALGEAYARFYAVHHGLDVVIVRPFNSYGPGELPGRYRNVIPNFLATAMRGEPLRITGTGEETRDFTYVDDVVSGMVGALTSATAPGEAFNLGTGREVRIFDLAELVNEVTGSSAGVELAPRRRWDTTSNRRASIELAEARIGYRPTVELLEGLRRTYEWLRGRGG